MKGKCLRIAVLCVLVGNLLSNFYRFTPWVFVCDMKWIKRDAVLNDLEVTHSNWSFSRRENHLTNATMNFGMYYSLICYDGESSCHVQTKAGRRDDMAIMFSKSSADYWYEMRKVEMTLETFSLVAGVIGLVTIVLTTVSKFKNHHAQLEILSAISLLISGIFQVTNLYPLISENALNSRYLEELDRIMYIYFPYSLPFGGLGAIIALVMALIFYAASVFRILKFEAKRTNACTNQYQIIRLEEYRVAT